MKHTIIKAFLVSLIIFPNVFFLGAQTEITLQAENADTIYHGSIDNNHAGYTGTGFVNLDNEEGSYLVWNIDMPQDADFRFTVRFANGGSDRTMHIIINDSLVKENYNFPSTGDWPNWDTTSFMTDLTSGLNAIKMVGSNPESGPNIDYIMLSNPDLDLDFVPVAKNDSISITINQPIIIDVLKNDYDYDGDELSISGFTQPTNGTVEKSAEYELLKYKPDPGYLGEDEFTYTITDGDDENTATVVIDIQDFDWSVAMADMIINTRTPETAGSWNYTVGLLLEGMLRVYKRTNDSSYLDFISDWADLHISETGVIDNNLNSLDNLMPGFMVLHLYNETKIEKFKLACDTIRKRFDTYPRTSDSAFWHNTGLAGETWLDGLYMSMPFLATYGEMFDDEDYCYHEVIRQFKVYINHLMNDETGILLHAYDEDGSASWALPPLNRSPHHWGRSIGWVVMGLTEVLEIIPEDFPERDTIIEMYTTVLESLANYQDTFAGLWYQVVDMADSAQNWHETSCTMMYTLSMKRAIQNGFLDSSYLENVDLGYMGALSKISKGTGYMVYLTDICEGTGVSADMNYYFNRNRNTNDNHGMGSFMIMNELIAYNNFAWHDSPSLIKPGKRAINKKLLKAFPNPCHNNVELVLDNTCKNLEIELFNMSGQRILQKKADNLTSNIIPLNVSGLPAGVYLCKVTTPSWVRTIKLLKE